MIRIELRQVMSHPAGQESDVLASTFTPDGNYVLAGYWDGSLRVWDTQTGGLAAELAVATKPVSACAVSPDGKRWFVGTMEGMLAQYNAQTLTRENYFLAHMRPISALLFSQDGSRLASTSWDRNVILWNIDGRIGNRPLGHHADIVAGCRFHPEGRRLASWSNDGVIIVWDTQTSRLLYQVTGHYDRITCGTISPDGRWLLTGGRDRQFKVWDLASGQLANSIVRHAEIRACFMLLDNETALVVDANGFLTLLQVPSLSIEGEMPLRLPVQCGDLSPSGSLLVLGCRSGQLALLQLDGLENVPLAVTASRSYRATATMLQRLFGQRQLTAVYQCICPVCRKSFELLDDAAKKPTTCPTCRRAIRICAVTQAADPMPAGV